MKCPSHEKRPAKGVSSAVVSEVVKAAGGSVKIEFYAWTRTVNLVKTDSSYVAYFPEYYSKANKAPDDVKNEPLVREVAAQLQANAKILEDKKLYVCFKKSPDGEKARKAFNAGLKKVDVNAIMKRYMN